MLLLIEQGGIKMAAFEFHDTPVFAEKPVEKPAATGPISDDRRKVKD